MHKKLPYLVAGSLAGLTILIGSLPAATTNTATPAPTPAMAPAPSATPAMAPNTTATTAPKPAAPAGNTTVTTPPASGNTTARGPARGPTPDLTKLPPVADKKDVTFEKDIAPIFKASCVGCHFNPTRPPGSGGLDLTTKESALKGGKTAGKAVVANHSDQSLVVLYASGALPTAMPPKNSYAKTPALTKDQIALIRAWIDQGAK